MKPFLLLMSTLALACATAPAAPGGGAEPSGPARPSAATPTLSAKSVQEIVSAGRGTFAACVAESAKKGTDAEFAGRRFALRLWIDPSGSVSRAALDDPGFGQTGLGECLRDAARRMRFPSFQGEVFHVEVPLILRSR